MQTYNSMLSADYYRSQRFSSTEHRAKRIGVAGLSVLQDEERGRPHRDRRGHSEEVWVSTLGAEREDGFSSGVNRDACDPDGYCAMRLAGDMQAARETQKRSTLDASS
jgi:hypothetical protein